MTKYDSSEYDFSKHQYTSMPGKKLSEIFPKDFYQSASSTSTGGVVYFSKVGKATCDYLPIEGGKKASRSTDPDSRSKGTK